MTEDDLVEEALRIYRRYQVEIVEALHLCPWAESSRQKGRVAERVITAPDSSLDEVLAAVDAFEKDATVEVGLLIFPRSALDPREFDRYVARVAREDATRRPVGSSPFAMAAFHPHAEPDLKEPERLIPFLRRTPDPTIQLVRLDVLARVRDGFAEGTQFIDVRFLVIAGLTAEDTMPLRERIARSNHRTVLRVGVDAIEKLLSTIIEDRNASYGRLGVKIRR